MTVPNTVTVPLPHNHDAWNIGGLVSWSRDVARRRLLNHDDGRFRFIDPGDGVCSLCATILCFHQQW
jgi:hypothetical protein